MMAKATRKKNKDAPLGFRVPLDVKRALERAAQADERSVSSLVQKVLADWLRAREFLK